jgi:hypothetical protein
LLAIGDAGRVKAELSLAGRTLDEGMAWAAAQLGRAPGSLVRPAYDMPDHPGLRGEAFRLQPSAAFQELAAFYDDAARLLAAVAAGEPGASEVRLWPHHFDLATLITVAPAAKGEQARTIGVGLSPGDASYAEPYLCVSPWPYPDAAWKPPQLAGQGRWHSQGFCGAVLTGSDLVMAGGAEAQAARAVEFLRAAIAVCHEIVDRVAGPR